MMLVVFSFRDLLWLAIVVALLWWWWEDRWVSEYTHQMFMRLKDGEMRQKDDEIKETKEMLEKQASAQNPPKK
jgi:hypothetical protein